MSDEKTVQTGQDNKPGKRPWFEISQDSTGAWHWMLWSSNGNEMATNVHAYPRKHDCTEAIKGVMATAQHASGILQSHPLTPRDRQ